MEPVDSHYQLKNLLKKDCEQKRWLAKAFENSWPVAINAYGVFARPARVLDSGQMEPSGTSRMIKRGWLYVDPDALCGLLENEEIEVGMFKSKPDSDLDTWATLKHGQKIRLSRDRLWIHEESLPLFAGEDHSADGELHKRKEGNMLRIIGALVSELKKCTGKSQTTLVNEITSTYTKWPGLSKSNLENYFAAANRSMTDF